MFPTQQKKIESDFKDKTLIFYNWKNLKSIHGSGKNLSKSKIQKESKDDINKNIRNLFKLKKKKESQDDIIENMRNVFKLKMENKVIKDKIMSDIRWKYCNNILQNKIHW